MTKIAVGNDPGKEGWVAWIDAETGKPLGCASQPLIGKGKGDTYDRQGMKLLVKEIAEAGEIVLWVIELQQAAGGRASLGTFGVQMKSYGVWLGILVALEIPHLEVTAQLWRKALGVVQPRYPKAKALPKSATKAEKKAWATKDRKRVEKQRKEGLERAVRMAQQLYPAVDMRRNNKCRVPSPDKAIAHLLARRASERSGLAGKTEAQDQKEMFA